MKIVATTRYCASLANPNKSTKAPVMHNAGFDAVGANLRYLAFEPTDIAQAMDAIRTLDFVGVTVSQPFKEAVMKHLDDIDPTAQAIGAVNVVHNQSGRLKGHNSDWIGAVDALEEHTPLSGKTVAVLGAGGAARAVAFGLKLRGASVKLFNRSDARGISLCDELGVDWCGGFDRLRHVACDVLVNTVPLGRDRSDSPIQEASDLNGIETVMDINIRKEKTDLLRDAERHGATTIGGIRMLVLQGVFAFELFSGHRAPVEVMQDAVIAEF